MTIKVFYIVLLIMIQCSNYYSQPSWEKIKTPTDFNLLRVFYLDSLHCWVAGDSGVIMFSSDQGLTWNIQNSGVNNYIADIFFLDDSLGWAVEFEYEGINFDIRSKILRTTNGGADWQIYNYRHLNINIITIFFHDSINGWIGGEPFELAYTNDAGENWVQANIDTGSFAYFPINKLRFSNLQYGFAVGGLIDNVGVVWRTNNAGELWKAYGIAPDKFDDFIFLDSINVLSLSADIERLYPIGVLNFNVKQNFWTYIELEKYGKVTSLARRTAYEIWGTLGCDTSYIVSFDTANTWQFFSTNDSLCINAIAFADSLHGIAVSEGGNIFRYIPQKPVTVQETDLKLPTNFTLEQNYPNPFNPITKIRWQSPSGGYQTIKVYDVLGNEIVTLVDEYKSAGIHEVDFNVAQDSRPAITSGIYFYQLRIGSFIETKKMILLK